MNFLTNYLLFNFALALSYGAARSLLGETFKKYLSYKQRLQLARLTLVSSVLAFCAAPYVMAWTHFSANLGYQFKPFVREASDHLMAYNVTLPMATTEIHNTVIALPAFEALLYGVFAALFIAGLVYQLNNAYRLFKLVRSAYLIRRMGHLAILSSSLIQIPLCFSFGYKSYVIMPESSLENNINFKLALAHEFQHLRQRDTRCLYLLAVLQLSCPLNPFSKLWSDWFNELQEFSCDEALLCRQRVSAILYGECLLDAATRAITHQQHYYALSLFGFKKSPTSSQLYRRINMLNQHRTRLHRNILSIIAATLLLIFSTSAAYALNGGNASSLSSAQVGKMVKEMNNMITAIPVTATPEVVAQLNAMRVNPKANAYMTAALQRLAHYRPMIQSRLQKANMPTDLLVLPLVESGYQNLEASKSNLSAAGIWQFLPATAHRYGLVINDTRDDRLDTVLETRAALNYLQNLHAQFNDWNLALIAYEIGEDATQNLINKTKSRNAWDLVQSAEASADLKKYLPALNAALIIMHHPELLNKG